MADKKKNVYKPIPMTEGKKNLIQEPLTFEATKKWTIPIQNWGKVKANYPSYSRADHRIKVHCTIVIDRIYHKNYRKEGRKTRTVVYPFKYLSWKNFIYGENFKLSVKFSHFT